MSKPPALRARPTDLESFIDQGSEVPIPVPSDSRTPAAIAAAGPKLKKGGLEPITARLPRALVERIRNMVHAENIAFAELLRQLLEAELTRREAARGGPYPARPSAGDATPFLVRE
ncbi:MAG: hypothetical protein F9K16_12895 [Thermoanaerobaculia bacterium]|nr:MAG: hypothetical protein F9K16_12895 [Thermoanaerobaculia bacterium]MBZ0102584.1 hypothetical protein [Thermoanaerobaculia bacterium]